MKHFPKSNISVPAILLVTLIIGLVVGGLSGNWPVGLYVLAILIALLFLASLFIWLSQKDAFLALSIVLLIMPFHTIINNWVEMQTISEPVRLLFSSWKEGSLLVILVVFLFRLGSQRRFILRMPPELALMLVFAFLCCIFIFTADNLKEGLLEYRNLFEGLLILLVLAAVQPPVGRAYHLVGWMVIEGAILSAWGYFSRYILDFYKYLLGFGFIPPDTTHQMLYYRSVFTISGNLYLRANSIFSGPNEFALYLAILIVVVVAMLLFRRAQLSYRQRVAYLLALLLLTIGEFISFSRNSWILIGVALIMMYIRLRFTQRKLLITVTAIVALIAGIILIPNLSTFIQRTISLKDSSAAGRMDLIGDGLRVIISHPLGIGLGNASYKFLGTSPYHVHTEFYLFIIAMELGWLGLLFYFIVMLAFIFKCYRLTLPGHPPDRRITGLIAMALLMGTLTSQFFAAISIEWIFQIYLWFFVGIAIFSLSSSSTLPPTATLQSSPDNFLQELPSQ